MRPDEVDSGGADQRGGAPRPEGGRPPGEGGLVVCGVDDSPAGRRALEWAVADAARRGARVRAVTCWSGYGMEAVGMVSSPDDCERECTRRLDEVVEQVRAAVPGAPEVERLVVQDRPSRALVAASLDADLLVLGSHGHRAAHDWTAGSTSQRVLHHAVCPVTVVPDPRCVARARKHLHADEHAVPATAGATGMAGMAGQAPSPV